MTHKTVRIDEKIYDVVGETAKLMNRSVSGQIAHWVNIGRVTEQSPSFQMERVESALRAEILLDDLTDDEAEVYFDKFFEMMREPSEAVKQSYAELGEIAEALEYTEE